MIVRYREILKGFFLLYNVQYTLHICSWLSTSTYLSWLIIMDTLCILQLLTSVLSIPLSLYLYPSLMTHNNGHILYITTSNIHRIQLGERPSHCSCFFKLNDLINCRGIQRKTYPWTVRWHASLPFTHLFCW